MREEKKLTLWERYLTKEIGIEFKACLYFFAILFFVCVFRMINGTFSVSIAHMAEMIFTCYIIGYMQVFLFGNFDDAGVTVCTLLYCGVSVLGGWLDRKVLATLIFAAYILLTYVCVILIYRSKRRIDDKKLNEELKLFQTEHKKSE